MLSRFGVTASNGLRGIVCRADDVRWVVSADPPYENWAFFKSGFSIMIPLGDFGDFAVGGKLPKVTEIDMLSIE